MTPQIKIILKDKRIMGSSYVSLKNTGKVLKGENNYFEYLEEIWVDLKKYYFVYQHSSHTFRDNWDFELNWKLLYLPSLILGSFFLDSPLIYKGVIWIDSFYPLSDLNW